MKSSQLYQINFKPALGCTSDQILFDDFLVRCFCARLRLGIVITKHSSTSRFGRSHRRVLRIHRDGRSLTWQEPLQAGANCCYTMDFPVDEEHPLHDQHRTRNATSFRQNRGAILPKLDLMSCTEVRYAFTPDPLNPRLNGTKILRRCCSTLEEASKSMCLLFPERSIDITCDTGDQCRVLLQGFSALCFRLHLAKAAHTRSILTKSCKINLDHDTERKKIRDQKARSSTSGQTYTGVFSDTSQSANSFHSACDASEEDMDRCTI